jgi:hypothetical protein
MEEENLRKIILQPIDSSLQKKTEKVVKEKNKRVVTKSNKWVFNEEDLLIENQQNCLNLVKVLFQKKKMNEIENLEKTADKKTTFLLQQIQQKVYGYKTQDQEKSLYMPTEFIDCDYVIEKLIESPLCFYCREPVQLLYEFVREPKQWTLDRIDNKVGHNRGNVEIACLRCNLRRRIMHHERFIFTKQLTITKSG